MDCHVKCSVGTLDEIIRISLLDQVDCQTWKLPVCKSVVNGTRPQFSRAGFHQDIYQVSQGLKGRLND